MAACSDWMPIGRPSPGRAKRLAEFGDRVTLRQANFEHLADVARPKRASNRPTACCSTSGFSSYQLADAERAFSFRAEGPLDMRFDTSRGVPASQLIAELDEQQLSDLFRQYGEEPHARRIARAIVEQRRARADQTGAQLAEIVVARAAPAPPRGRRRVHPATRVFQALRIAVNRELETLPHALDGGRRRAARRRPPGGHQLPLARGPHRQALHRRGAARLHCPPELPVCVCGHSPRLAPVGPQPRRPTAEEIERNPRSRSALLRAARKLAA